MKLWTIGYEGWGFDLWVEALREQGVSTVVDVRELPLSRRPGWSKRALAENLSERGFGYIHMRELGTPAPLRHALREGGLTFAEFTPQFEAILAERPAEIDALVTLAHSQPVVLMCWEEDPGVCHRSLVARAAKRRSKQPVAVVNIRRISS